MRRCGRHGFQSQGSKSDLRNHQAIVQPRLYDSLMVTQITLNTEPHGFDSCQEHSYENFVVPGQAWSAAGPLLS
jgi:hypothetical protein